MEELLPLMNNYKLVLGSGSPRRKELLGGMGLTFEVRVSDVDESIDPHWPLAEVAQRLSERKADALLKDAASNEVFVTADTVVHVEGKLLNKPTDKEEALVMLKQLSGKSHEVFTGVCVATKEWKHSFTDCTKVTFANLNERELQHYIENYKPFDKAGSYGAQDFIGLVGIAKLEGSYFNVMGLPTHMLYAALKERFDQE
jgi:septum formation protein